MKTKGYVARMRRLIHLKKSKAAHQSGDFLQLDLAVARNAKQDVEARTVDQRERSIPVSLPVDVGLGQRTFGARDVLNSGKNVAGQSGTGVGSVGLHAHSIKEFGPYANRRDTRGGYFAVCGWEFHWFEDEAEKRERPSWLKTRDEALRAAVAASGAMQAGGLPC
jgi:hypothetical protein